MIDRIDIMDQRLPKNTKSPSNQAPHNTELYQSQGTYKSTQKRQSPALAGALSKLRPLTISSSKTLKSVPKKKLENSLENASLDDTTVHTTPSTAGRVSRKRNLHPQKVKKPRPSSSPNPKDLSDETTLRYRVSSLEKNFKSQDKVLQELDQKINAERLELSQLSQQLSTKKQREYQVTEEEVKETKQKEQESNVRPEKSTLRAARLPINEVEPMSSKYSPLLTGVVDQGRQFVQVSSADENYKYKWLHLKDYVKSIESHYELKISEMKLEIERLTEENYRLKYRHSSIGEAKADDQYFNNMDSIYKKKIAKAEARFEQKETEMLDREISFRHEVENLNVRIRDLQIELNNKSRSDEKVGELKSQLSLREKEINSLKTYYSEKLQIKADEISKIKVENSKVQMGYLDEIRALKRDIDRMAYDNKRLSLSQTHQNTHALITSLVT